MWTIAAPTTVVPVVAVHPIGPNAVRMSVVSVVAVHPIGPNAVRMSVVSVVAVHPIGPNAVRIGRTGIGPSQPGAAMVREISPVVAGTPQDRDAAAVKVGVVEPIVARPGPKSRICPMRFRPAISIPLFGGIC
ncbi:hypothetical protein GCM10011588_69900 [Nocardia jinanensis]|uniref:Uncharacterized protein n=1 Tax=Nocardia jinanensis TaxID=382504 RepID=A0A917RY12_9NOCA|nr:hypothetical protein GCM10011588_69900 [Nocardia jinanensis]